jgi:hypothetical protein
LEGNDKSLEPGGRQGLYVKTAYGGWKNIISGSNLLIGLVPTPTWAAVEVIWGYRSVEKTITDMRNLGSGSDMGVLLRGEILSALSMNYVVMIGNGNAQKPEDNKYKKYYTLLSVNPIQNYSVEIYVDHESYVDNKDRTTWKLFASYIDKDMMIGSEIIEQVRRKQDLLFNDYAPFGVALFSWHRLSEQCKVFGRIDYYDPNRFSDYLGFYEYFFSFGIDYMPVKDFHIIPNVWINNFTDKSAAGRKKDTDIVPRITFYFLYN